MINYIKTKLYDIPIKKRVLQNLYFGVKKKKNALIFYRSGNFILQKSKFPKHTNELDCFFLVQILKSLNYNVDIVDRSIKNFLIKKKYQLFLGVASGTNGKHFLNYCKKVKEAIKVAICTGPRPAINNLMIINRYKYFNKKYNVKIEEMRLSPNTNKDDKQNFKLADYLFTIGEKNNFCTSTYKSLDKKIFNYLPICQSKNKFKKKYLITRKLNNFLCFVGDGFIVKGVDIVIEVFLKYPNLNLIICGPDSEKKFFKIFNDKIKNSKNIKYLGFVNIQSNEYLNLIKQCSYTIMFSCAEGCATSIVTNMYSGLVPISNYENGVNIGKFGIKIPSGNNKNLFEKLEKAVLSTLKIKRKKYNKMAINTFKDVQKKYSSKNFKKTIKNNLKIILKENAILEN